MFPPGVYSYPIPSVVGKNITIASEELRLPGREPAADWFLNDAGAPCRGFRSFQSRRLHHTTIVVISILHEAPGF